MSFSRYSILPGFWLSFGYSLFWLSFIVLLPLVGLILYSTHINSHQLVMILTDQRLLSALKLRSEERRVGKDWFGWVGGGG